MQLVELSNFDFLLDDGPAKASVTSFRLRSVGVAERELLTL